MQQVQGKVRRVEYEEVKSLTYVNNIIKYAEILKYSVDQLLELINTFINVARFKINVQKSHICI